MKKLPKAEIERRVQNAARVLGLEPFLKRKPRALSGGQRQRVAMGRAIVREPAAFLMDEPLSNLDAKLRVQMRAEIAGLQRDLGVTTIYVTHDQVEAMTMGDRVAVIRKGELQQVAEPQTLYDRPVNLFVGGFIGSPAMNMVEATLEQHNGGYAAVVGEQRIAIAPETLQVRPGLAAYAGKTVVLGIRPEDLEDAALVPDAPTDQRLRGTTDLTEALGSEIMVHFSINARQAMTEDVRELAQDVGDDRAPNHAAEAATARLVGRFGARSRVRAGEAVEVAVDTRSLHFFDPETGLGIYDGTSDERSWNVKNRYLLGAGFGALVLLLAVVAAASGGAAKSGSAHGQDGRRLGNGHLRRHLDRLGGHRLRRRDQGLQQALPERPHQVQPARQQRVRPCSRRRSPAATRPTWPTSRSPGTSSSSSQQGQLKPITYAKSAIAANFAPSWLQLGTFSGKLYALVFKASNKSLFWYNVPAFKAAGMTAAEDVRAAPH